MEKSLLAEKDGGRSADPLFHGLVGFWSATGVALMLCCYLFITATPATTVPMCGGLGAGSVNVSFGQFSKLVFAARNVSAPDFESNLEAAASCFAEDAMVRFYNQNTSVFRVFRGKADMKRFLKWALGIVCVEESDISEVHDVDEVGKTVFIAWKYSNTGCKPSTESYVYSKDLKILRLNAFVNMPPLPSPA
eukprot:TRINITY_DN13515_c0_g1_i2.p1 TRINITY_DN13515_c0_g1~~TRINITY_DN13515_c0_g1_i2.p1  ORF type:complete len:192 (+),score=32.27 TRINITY_DN13515_c0_g1_i2:91-666(+)